jgi:uncharacterized membrane protein YgcG
MISRAGLLAAALLLFAAAPALAEERITDFSSDITVARNGQLTVTETISVLSEGREIRHGIFRVIPTEYRGSAGERVRVGFDVRSATLDGHSENFSVDNVDEGKRIKIGDPGTILEPGEHVFALTYTTTRQIGFYADHDELYWNVTGTLWQFPIERAEATVRLPGGARIERNTFYTGAAGSGAQNAQARSQGDGAISFSTTGPLAAGEGLTIVVGFDKGAVIPPTAAEEQAEFFAANGQAVAAACVFLALLAYFLFVWWFHGRDPKRGVVIPLFAPPNGFSPGAVRFVRNMGYDDKAYSASLVDMAVRGYLKIAQTGSDSYTLTRTGKSAEEAGLPHGEAAIADELFDGQDSIELKQKNHAMVQGSMKALQSSLDAEYEKNYFVTNVQWFAGGAVVLAVGAVWVGSRGEIKSDGIFMALALALFGIGCGYALYVAWKALTGGSKSQLWTIFGVAVAGVFGWYKLHDELRQITLLAGGIIVLTGILTWIFHQLMKAPTAAGAKVLDQIEGLRMFLVTAEKHRLEVLNPPQVTPEVFERFLPYAIALDCANQWSRKFQAEAAAAGSVPDSGLAYVPIWYSGSSFEHLGAAGFADALGSSMASAASSASQAPGSSSGFSGGFSGGGGGGGGGGGW